MSNAKQFKAPRPRTAVIACSGNSSNGELGDCLARRLNAEGLAQMYSIAKIRTKISASSHLAMTPKVLVIDGCHAGCASECLKELGYTDFDIWDLREYLDLKDRNFSEEEFEEAFFEIKNMLCVSIKEGQLQKALKNAKN